MSLQLPLPVSLPDDQTFSTYQYSVDNVLVAHLQEQLSGIQDNTTVSTSTPLCFIHGAQGTGKSHLLYALCQLASEYGLQAQYLDLRQLRDMPVAVLQGVEAASVLCFDNIDAVAGIAEWELELFDRVNKMRESDKSQFIVFTANAGPKAMPFNLPDLISRLTWGTVFQTPELSDEDRISLLDKRLAQRGLVTNEETLKFILHRVNRDLCQLMTIVDTLDQKSLQAQRRLTIPFVKQALNL